MPSEAVLKRIEDIVEAFEKSLVLAEHRNRPQKKLVAKWKALLPVNPDRRTPDDVCPECGEGINLDVCYCGIPVKEHNSRFEHSAVPDGCICGYGGTKSL